MTDHYAGRPRLSTSTAILMAATAALTFPARAELVIRTGASSDQTKPLIASAPTVVSISDRNAVIRWTTDEVADSRVSYQADGQTQQAGTIAEWVSEHFVVLSKLSPGTQYSASAQSQDAAGNLSEPSQPVGFATTSTPDSSAPVMQGLPETPSVTATTVAITWTTDEASRGRVEFGPDANHMNRTADQNGYYGTQHAVTLVGLTASQTYHYRLVSTDPSGNSAKSETYSVSTSTDPGNGEPPPGPAKAEQTIAFDPVDDQVLATKQLTLKATASSGLTVSFASTPTAVCKVTGNTLILVKAGACTVQASQPGNADYQAAPAASQSFDVLARAPQSIELGNPGDQVYGSAFLQLEPAASSGLRVGLRSSTPDVCVAKSGYRIRLRAAGACNVVATQSGNRKYLPAEPVTISFEVAKAEQSITFNATTPVSKPVEARSFLVRAKASSGLKVSFRSGDAKVCTVSATGRVKALAAGTCSVTASQPGNRNYLAAAEVTHAIVIE